MKNKIFIISILLSLILILFLGLDLSNRISYADNTSNLIYDVIKQEAESNSGYAAKYTGQHNDTLDNSGTEDIYYYKGNVTNKWNVVFAGKCWQMIRTTDTGGVKLIYNGEYDELNKCNSARSDHRGIVATNHLSEDLGSPYVYGDSYTYNENTGVFTLKNTVTELWSRETSHYLTGKYTCKSDSDTCNIIYGINGSNYGTKAYVTSFALENTHYSHIAISPFNLNYQNLAMVGYMFNNMYNYETGSATSGTLYGNSVEYENGEYRLINTSSIRDDYHHYSCNNSSGVCSEVRYIYHLSGGVEYYIRLTNGKTIEEAVNEMLYNNNVNTKDSSIKIVIDKWYEKNMDMYTPYLEDVIYCNDRTQKNPNSYTWNPNGGSISSTVFFGTNDNLYCTNETDKFSILNPIAKLDYPVGLATISEIRMTGSDSTISTGQDYWLLSPRDYKSNYGSGADDYIVFSTGEIYYAYVGYAAGVRPVVSLKPGTEYISGSGTTDDPYVIDTRPNIITEVENGTIDETTRIIEGDSITIKYTPNEGYKLKSVLIDNLEVDINMYPEEYTFENVTEDHSIKVVYEIMPEEDNTPLTPEEPKKPTPVTPEDKKEISKKDEASNKRGLTPNTVDKIIIDVEIFTISVLVIGICLMIIKRTFK